MTVSTFFNDIRNIVFGLHEDAEDVPQLRKVRGGNHFTNRVKILIGKAVTLVVSSETKECHIGEAEPGFGRVEGPVVIVAHF